MEVTPSLAVTRLEKLSPGDLFIYGHEHGLSVAMVALHPLDDDKYVLPLGPIFPPNIPSPTAYLPRGRISALSFGAQYRLRLPTSADGWSSIEPKLGDYCLLVAEEGVFVRANFAPPGREFHPCYVGMKDGRIFATTGGSRPQLDKPTGEFVYALRWEIFTTEKQPRIILSYPF
jgi:hypothetical protein